MKTLIAVAALSLVACGPADTALRAPDGGLFNIQCKNLHALVRECDPREFPKACSTASGIDSTARPNGIVYVEKCVGFDCCYWPDGGRF